MFTVKITLKDSGYTTVIYMHTHVLPNFIEMIFGFDKLSNLFV